MRKSPLRGSLLQANLQVKARGAIWEARNRAFKACRRHNYPRRYLFCRAPDGQWRQLLRCGRGLADIVHTGNEACPVPDRGSSRKGSIPMGCFRWRRSCPASIICNGNAFAGLIALIERIGGPACEAWVGSLKCKIAIADLDPESVEPVMTAVELSRQTRPLDLRRKIRNWEPIER
jgi:hypothetical protein